MDGELSELALNNKIEVTIDYETFTDESGNPSERSIVKRGRTREVWIEGKLIGGGTYGSVSLFTHKRRNGEVKVQAVKRIIRDPRSFGVVGKELDALLKFSLPKYEEIFVKCYGWYTHSQFLFLVMEYLENGDLNLYIKKLGQGLPESEVKIIISQITQGIELLHEEKFVHRDIKPSNIFIAKPGPNWQIKIGDFGTSKRVKIDSSLRTVTGTSVFCAPEIHDIYPPGTADDSRYNYTEKVDIWSIGATTFYLLFYIYPFPRPTVPGLIKYIERGVKLEFPPVPEISKHCYEFLGATMAPDASVRLSAIGATEHSWLNYEVPISNISTLESQLDAVSLSPAFRVKSEDVDDEISSTQNQAEVQLEPKKRTSTRKSLLGGARVQDDSPSGSPLASSEEDRMSPSQHTKVNHPVETSEYHGRADWSVSTFEPMKKDARPLEVIFRSYINDLLNGQITTDQLRDLRLHLGIRKAAKRFLELKGHAALGSTFEKLNYIDHDTLSSTFACIMTGALTAEAMRQESEIAHCLWNLVQHPEGIVEMFNLKTPHMISTIINGLIACEISARQYLTQALIMLLDPGNFAFISITLEHVSVLNALEEIEPVLPKVVSRTAISRCGLWISNVKFCLGLLLAEGQISLPRKSHGHGLKDDGGNQTPPKTGEESLQYLTCTMKLINSLIEVPSKNPMIKGRAIRMLNNAGVHGWHGGLFDDMLSLGASPDIKAEITRSVKNGLCSPDSYVGRELAELESLGLRYYLGPGA